MSVILLIMLLTHYTIAGCVDAEGLDKHVEELLVSIDNPELPYQQLKNDLLCLSGSGFKTTSAKLFVTLALAADKLEKYEESLAALRALLVIDSEYQMDANLGTVSFKNRWNRAIFLGPDTEQFGYYYLGKLRTEDYLDEIYQKNLDTINANIASQNLRLEKRNKIANRMIASGSIATTLGIVINLAYLTGDKKTESHYFPIREEARVFWTTLGITGGAVLVSGLTVKYVSFGPGVFLINF